MNGPAWNETALHASPSLLDRRALFGGLHAWTWRDVHGAALDLAQRIGPADTVCNLCASRAGFLVAWLAALRRGARQVLPPSGGTADLAAILGSARAPLVIVDDAALVQAQWREQATCLVFEPRPPAAPVTAEALAWSPTLDANDICLFTSGTTGRPEPQAKSLGHLVQGAHVLAERLAQDLGEPPAAWNGLVCSVPPQHMFGLETSVMLPLITGLAVVDRRPLLPLDVRAAIELCAGRAAWVATPLHLRAQVQAGVALPDCRLALVSTMALAAPLAAQAESLLPAPVLEIFGSTETGVLAMRRTAREPHWTPVGGVHMESSDSVTQVWGAHFPSPRQLADDVQMEEDGRFRLLGRHADLLKIGGRRASLAGLNLLLQEFPGIGDGVFYLPPTGAPTERLVLIHAGAPIDRAALDRWLRERVDAAFLPRALLQVDRLPRTDNGKLPRAALDALYAAQRASNAPGSFTFEVPPQHPCLPGHFPGRPVVPGVLLLDHVTARLRQLTGRAVVGLPRVKFRAPLRPGEAARVQWEPRGDATVSFRVARVADAQLLAEGTATLAPAATEAA